MKKTMLWRKYWGTSVEDRSSSLVLGAPLWQVGANRVWSWLNGFPRTILSAAQLPLAPESPTWVVEPDKKLAEFRRYAGQCVDGVFQSLENATAVLGGEARVVWCLENVENRGLEDFEAEFLFGQRLAIDALGQINRGQLNSRLVVIGRLRVESLSLLFRLGPADGRETACLEVLNLHGASFVTLLVDSEQSRAYLAEPQSLFVQRLRSLLRDRKFSLGLYVPGHRSRAALANLRQELEPLQQLAGEGEPIRLVRFADPACIDPPLPFLAAIAGSSLWGDISLAAPLKEPGPNGDHVLNGPYHPTGAYQPMPFDLRLAAGIWRSEGCLELPRVDLDQFHEDWQRLARWRTEPTVALLARLLDGQRIEKYFIDFDKSLALRQAFHEYRVYNRPRPECSPRCTLVDCGVLDAPERVHRILSGAQKLAGSSMGRWRLCPTQIFLDQALAQAKSRSPVSTIQAVQDQMAAHYYLDRISIDAPLRQDVQDFVHWLPASLGTALELGSGFGHLARALLNRCDRYVCVELDDRMFNGMPEELRRHATVADIHALPFEDQSFDSVLVNNVLEHSYDPLRCLQEIQRVLKSSGRLFVLIPLDGLNREFDIWKSHFWKADVPSVQCAVRLAGLEPIKCDIFNIYQLGVDGAFPSCNGLHLKLEARRQA